MKDEPGILATFAKRQEDLQREMETLDREMSKRRVEQEKIQRQALAKLEKARADLATMKADYHALEKELEDKTRQKLETSEITVEKVKRGEFSLRDFFKEGLSPKDIEAKAKSEATDKLADALKLIRAKAAEVFQLELEEAEARVSIRFTLIYPGQTAIAKLKTEVQLLERGITDILGDYSVAHRDRDLAKTNIALCENKSIAGVGFDSLTYDELRDLRLDPRITEPYAAQLEDCIASMKPDQRCMLALKVPFEFGEACLVFRILDDEGAK